MSTFERLTYLTDIDGPVQPDDSVPMRRPLNLECTTGQDSASQLCVVSSGVLLKFFFIFFMTCTVAKSYAVIVLLHWYEWPPFSDVCAVLLIILQGIVD